MNDEPVAWYSRSGLWFWIVIVVCDFFYNPGIPKPPVIFVISDWAIALP
jgi:hypothetical protein